ncbi:MAG TPA: AAA family ATPase [Candidatus Solibacter sp.]|nr:AAA family ATPase [Candidatus Solibacter sp.]
MLEASAPRPSLPWIPAVREQYSSVIVGQRALLDRLLAALITGNHVLIEGVPGLGKTLAILTLARSLDATFHRIQFTPDLLPSDIVGTLIYDARTGEFTPRKGPVFANIVLADEVNRAPAKVQSALLEAMQERQVTIGDNTFPLPSPFLVLATQNPIEQEGTYPLPEAQLDRFLFKLVLDYPAVEEERVILDRMVRCEPAISVTAVASAADILESRRVLDAIHLETNVRDYIVNVVDATRHPAKYGLKLDTLIRYGASPRASVFLAIAAKCAALLDGRAFVVPQDVKDVVIDVLRHRVLLTYEADAEGVTSERIVQQVLAGVEVP